MSMTLGDIITSVSSIDTDGDMVHNSWLQDDLWTQMNSYNEELYDFHTVVSICYDGEDCQTIRDIPLDGSDLIE